MHVVTLSYDLAPDEETLVRWADRLELVDASVAYIPGRGVDVTVWVDGFDAIKAPAFAVEQVDQIVMASPVAIESVSETEYERRADAPTLPHLVSAPEVAELLGGISRQRVHQLRALAAFPEPLVDLRTGPIWDARAIQRFSREWERKPGRPAKVS